MIQNSPFLRCFHVLLRAIGRVPFRLADRALIHGETEIRQPPRVSLAQGMNARRLHRDRLAPGVFQQARLDSCDH